MAVLQDVLALGSDNLGLPVEFPGYERWVLHLKLRWISLLWQLYRVFLGALRVPK